MDRSAEQWETWEKRQECYGSESDAVDVMYLCILKMLNHSLKQ